ncbi:hypothetical protein Hbl1158_02950 [Halobaculum sp. CBA1158]|uniref:hypothetical protein n=1 Tax=Halobaculum sp. CBA1158 TaxID=2904243 RepID=UPI001F39CBF0|nr:hypothetical protein [Halobaculum sp. CBA1158]UIP00345.1 hypothetical protein Hbl1158_02950 [Halobaculum sp. CBA1158]
MSADTISVDWKWTDYQAEVRDTLEAAEHDLVVFRTGYGGGKSITGAQWIHRGSLQLDHGESLVMGQDFQKARGTTFKVFFETLPGEQTVPDDAGGDPENSPIVAGYNQNQNRITYITGHKVRLGSADKWNRYAGGEFHRIWCDEVAHYDNTDLHRLHEMLVTRQRTAAGPNTTLWTSTGNGYNQFYDITERQVGPDDDPLPWADAMRVIVASTEHNELLPDDGLEKIRNQFEGTAREEQGLHGGFAAAEGLVYDAFSRKTHVRPADDLADRLVDDQAIYGYDAGWNDPRVVLDIRQTHGDQYVVWDHFYASESHLAEVVDPDDVLDDGVDAWMYDRPLGRVYSEHEPAHIQQFRKAGWPAVKADKSIDGGIDHVRSRLAIDGEGRPGLLVAERCGDLIQEFLSYKEEHVGKAAATDHALDALRYALFTHTPQQAAETDPDDTGVSGI